MTKHFYSHLLSIEEIEIKLDKLDMSKKEKDHLKTLVHSNAHAVVLDTVLTHLPKDDRKLFFKMLEKNDNGEIWEFLNKRSINLDAKIAKNLKNLFSELEKDIEEHFKK